MSSLKKIEACRQSPWLDFLEHRLLETGQLRTLMRSKPDAPIATFSQTI